GDQSVVGLGDQQIDDEEQVFISQRVEQNNFIQTIQKFRVEHALHFTEHEIVEALRVALFRSRLESHRGPLLKMPRAEIGSHDHNRVAEIDCISQPVRQLPILKNLEQ